MLRLLRLNDVAVLLAFSVCAACVNDGLEPARPCGSGLTFGTRFADNTEFRVAIEGSVSRELLPGRSMDLTGGHFRYGGSWGANDRPIEWCSSEPTVLEIQGDRAIASAVGKATLYAWIADGLADSVTITVVPSSSGFDLLFLGDEIGAGSVGVALSDAGGVVGTVGISNFLWRDHVLTDLGACRPLDVNASNQIACSDAIWTDGMLTPVTFSGATNVDVAGINDLGHVVGRASQATGCPVAFYWRDESSVDKYDISCRTPQIAGVSNDGAIVGTTPSLSSGYQQPFIIENASRRALRLEGRWGYASGIATTGDAIGYSECYPGSFQIAPMVWRASATGRSDELLPPVADCPLHGWPLAIRVKPTAINAVGLIVGTIEQPTSMGALWRDQRLVRLSALVDEAWEVTSAADINASGRILAQVRHTTSGKSGTALLIPR